MSLRYKLDPKYISKFSKIFNLNAQTIVRPQVTITFNDLQFQHLKHKTITSFKIILLKKNNDIVEFDTLNEDWIYQLSITENTIIRIEIEFYWKEDKDKVHIMDWEEWILENSTTPIE